MLILEQMVSHPLSIKQEHLPYNKVCPHNKQIAGAVEDTLGLSSSINKNMHKIQKVSLFRPCVMCDLTIQSSKAETQQVQFCPD